MLCASLLLGDMAKISEYTLNESVPPAVSTEDKLKQEQKQQQ